VSRAGRPVGAENERRLRLLARMLDGQSFFEPYLVQADLASLRAICTARGVGIEIHRTDRDARTKRPGCRVFRRTAKDRK